MELPVHSPTERKQLPLLAQAVHNQAVQLALELVLQLGLLHFQVARQRLVDALNFLFRASYNHKLGQFV
jgi:hypothetical protein